MVTKGQTGENRFGPDPGTSPEIFPDRAKLTSAGVMTIVGASVNLLGSLCAWFFPTLYYGGEVSMPLAQVLQSVIVPAAILVMGILLVGCDKRERAQPALWILLAVCGWLGISSLVALPGLVVMMKDGMTAVHGFLNVASTFLRLATALMAALLLFAPKNRGAVRGSTMAMMAVGGLYLVAWLLMEFRSESDIETLGGIFTLLGTFGTIGWMTLAWTFFSRKEEPAKHLKPEETPIPVTPVPPVPPAIPKESAKRATPPARGGCPFYSGSKCVAGGETNSCSSDPHNYGNCFVYKYNSTGDIRVLYGGNKNNLF
jgi:hypothetical protein